MAKIMENGIPIVCFSCGGDNLHDVSLMPSIVRVKDTLECSDCGTKFRKTSWAWDKGDREPGRPVRVVGLGSTRESGVNPYTGTGVVVRRNHNCPYCEGESTRPNGTDSWQCQGCFKAFFATGSEFEIYDITKELEGPVPSAGVLRDIEQVFVRVGVKQRNNERQKAYQKRLSPERKQRLNKRTTERHRQLRAAMPLEERRERGRRYHETWAEKAGADKVRQIRDAARQRFEENLSHEDYRALRNRYERATFANKAGEPLNEREVNLAKLLVDGAVSIGKAVESMGLCRPTGYNVWHCIQAKLGIETVEQLKECQSL